MTLSARAVSAQSGYWLLPRNPSCAKKFTPTTKIVNQRAQLDPFRSAKPASTSSTPQMIITQPQPVRLIARNPDCVTT
jgi:hypothetical protein